MYNYITFFLRNKAVGDKATKNLGLRQLADASRKITTHLELGPVFGQIVSTMAADLGALFAMVWVVEHGDSCQSCDLALECLIPGECLHLKAWDGRIMPPDTVSRRLPVGVMKIGEIARLKEPYITEHLSDDPMLIDQNWVRENGITAFAGFPLVRGDRLLGVLVYFGDGHVTPELFDILSTFAHHCASAIEDAQQYERVVQSEEHYRALIDGAIDAVLICSLSGNILNSNISAERMFGFSKDLLRIMNIRDLDLSSESKLFGFIGSLASGGPASYETTFMTKSGGLLPVEVRAGLIKYGKGMAVQAFVRDITERRKIERQKADFISMITHDLKGPLSVIMGYADVISDQYGDKLPEFVSSGVESIKRSSESLLSLIDDYLSLSKMEAGMLKMEKAATSLSDILEKAAENAVFKAREKNIRLEVVCPLGLMARADARHLERAVTNLLRNAVQHTQEGGEVILSCHAEIQPSPLRPTLRAGTPPLPEGEGLRRIEGNRVRITVSDNGSGIASEDLPRIFDKYYSNGMGGTGLGLAVVKSVAEGHSGSVAVESEPGKGSRFTITLPM